MANNILVVEDNDHLRGFISTSLIQENYDCSVAASGSECLKILKHRYFDLILMDLDLGDMHGKDILKLIRNQSNPIPVIIISTFNNIDTKVGLFDLGCDDYVTKPFYIEELIARVKRQLRIINRHPVIQTPTIEDVEFNDIKIDFNSTTIFKDGERLDLSKKIFDMISFFVNNSNQLISKEQLITRFWGESDIYPENTLAVHIHKIRSAIESNPSSPKYLKTKRGLGYIFVR